MCERNSINSTAIFNGLLYCHRNCLVSVNTNNKFIVSGRSPRPRRAGTLPPLPARAEDLPCIPLLHSDGHDDHPRLLLLLHHDFSRLDVPLKYIHKPREAFITAVASAV